MTQKDQPLHLDENPWGETVVLSIFGAFAGLLLWVGFLDSRHPIVAVPAVLALAAGAAVALRVLEGPQEYWLLDEGIRCRSRKGIELIEYEEISRVEHFKPFRTAPLLHISRRGDHGTVFSIRILGDSEPFRHELGVRLARAGLERRVLGTDARRALGL